MTLTPPSANSCERTVLNPNLPKIEPERRVTISPAAPIIAEGAASNRRSTIDISKSDAADLEYPFVSSAICCADALYFGFDTAISEEFEEASDSSDARGICSKKLWKDSTPI